MSNVTKSFKKNLLYFFKCLFLHEKPEELYFKKIISEEEIFPALINKQINNFRRELTECFSHELIYRVALLVMLRNIFLGKS